MGSGLMPNPLEQMSPERRIILAAAICILFSFFYTTFLAPPPAPPPAEPGLEAGEAPGFVTTGPEKDLEAPEEPSSTTRTVDATAEPDRTEQLEIGLEDIGELTQSRKPEVRELVVDTPRAQYVFSTQGASLRSCRLKDYAENDPPVRLLEAERDRALSPEIKQFWQARIEEIHARNELTQGKRFRKGEPIPEEAWVELVPQYGDQTGYPLKLQFLEDLKSEPGVSDDGLVYKCNSGNTEIGSEDTHVVEFVARTDSGIVLTKSLNFSGQAPHFEISINIESERGPDIIKQVLGKFWVLEWPDGLGHLPFSYKGSQEDNQLYALINDSKDNTPTLRNWLLKQAPGTSENYRHDLCDQLTDDVDWINVETRYFIATFLPQGLPMQGVFLANKILDRPQFDTRVGMGVISQITEGPRKISVYIGPKLTSVLKDLGKGLERVVYDSWFGSICLLVEWLLAVFYALIPSYGIAIVLLCIFSKIVLYPLTYKQAQMQKKMAVLQPKIKELQERFKDDKQKLSQEQMKLWKKHGVNPAGGCLPMLAQLPIFIALYRTIQSSIDLRGAPFLWIDDLSLPDMTFFLPAALPFIGNAVNILPFIMTGISYVQMQQQKKMMPDPSQAQMMTFMTIFIFFVLYNFSSGLVLYWTVNSLTQWIQQKMMERVGHAATPAARAQAAAAQNEEPGDGETPKRVKKRPPQQRKSKPRRRRAGSRH